jgi:hypothetical protein
MTERDRLFEEPPAFQPFPFALPQELLRDVAAWTPHRLVGLHWEPAGDELVYVDKTRIWTGANPWPWLELLRQRQVWHWLNEHLVNLGSSDFPATHWLIVQQEQQTGFLSKLALAKRQVKEQRLHLEEGGLAR